jgi:hypothetical protein
MVVITAPFERAKIPTELCDVAGYLVDVFVVPGAVPTTAVDGEYCGTARFQIGSG